MGMERRIDFEGNCNRGIRQLGEDWQLTVWKRRHEAQSSCNLALAELSSFILCSAFSCSFLLDHIEDLAGMSAVRVPYNSISTNFSF